MCVHMLVIKNARWLTLTLLIVLEEVLCTVLEDVADLLFSKRVLLFRCYVAAAASSHTTVHNKL